MKRARFRLRLDDQGLLEVVDPGFDALPLLQEVQPDFRVLESPLDVDVPAFLRARRMGVGLPLVALEDQAEGVLWATHRSTMDRLRNEEAGPAPAPGEVSLLGLKREIARRLLVDCGLCAHRCGVDRTRGELGVCRLGTEATVGEHFVHISEEPPINPSLVLNLAGCGMRCRYCQQSALLDPAAVSGDGLDATLWPRLDIRGARTLSFVGGNPDESLYAILRFLEAAPEHWSLPLVWNCHAYSTPETLALLDGIVEVYVPDMKYGNEACAQRWSAAPGYVASARETIAAMVAQRVTVIVRILVLPGHVDCCHVPALEYLATLPRERLSVSVRGQYCPDWRITARDGAMAQRPGSAEVDAVRARARALELPLADGGAR